MLSKYVSEPCIRYSIDRICLKPLLYLRTLFSGGVKRASHYPPLRSLYTPAHKLVVDGLFHIDTGTCRTALTAVKEHTLMSLLHCQIH